MIPNLPAYISWTFIATALATVAVLLYAVLRASYVTAPSSLLVAADFVDVVASVAGDERLLFEI